MNRFGQIAMKHWERWLPERYGQLDDPDAFFTRLGEEIQERILDLERALAGDDPPGEGYVAKVGRLNMARLSAEGQALREMALVEPEPDVAALAE